MKRETKSEITKEKKLMYIIKATFLLGLVCLVFINNVIAIWVINYVYNLPDVNIIEKGWNIIMMLMNTSISLIIMSGIAYITVKIILYRQNK